MSILSKTYCKDWWLLSSPTIVCSVQASIQNGGRLSKNKRKLFALLTDKSILFAKQVVLDVFADYFVMLQGKE